MKYYEFRILSIASSKNLFQPSNTLIDGEQIPLDSFLGSLLLLGIQSNQRL
jgi:hypothetical protein